MGSEQTETRTLSAAPLLEPAGFESRLNAFRHRRLRLVTLVLGVVALTLLTTAMLVIEPEGLGLTAGQATQTTATLAGFILGMVGLHVALRAIEPNARVLAVVDAGVTFGSILMCALVYAFDYEAGPTMIPALMGFMLVVRAVVVPSGILTTLLLSLPAAPTVLWIQLEHGLVYALGGATIEGGWFVSRVIWDQVFLLLCVAVSVLASRVNFRLRLEADRAARLGKYVLEEKIGSGGMGVVYRASHALLHRPTAVKIIRSDRVDELTLKRFEREVTLTAKLNHPHTVEVFDYGRSEEGVFYYAMELLHGADLRRIVRSAGPLPASRVIHVLSQALDALEEAHRTGLVHRDVKSSNIFLCRVGQDFDFVKVTDFGLVKDIGADSTITVSGEVLGTPQTISPEAIQGKPVGPAADIYAVGQVGSYLLTGRHAFDAATSAEYYSCHLYTEPVPPSSRVADVPADLEGHLLRCLEKDPADRPTSAADLRESLLSCEDAGLWSQEDAAGWWREFRGEARGEDTSASASTLG